MENTGMQVAVVRRAATRLRLKPSSYDQTTFGRISDFSPCGTVTCIAGELVIASEEDEAVGLAKLWEMLRSRSDPPVTVFAAAILGVPFSSVTWLFAMSSNNWPSLYRDRALVAWTRQDQAAVAADLLDAIADGKVDLYTRQVSI